MGGSRLVLPRADYLSRAANALRASATMSSTSMAIKPMGTMEVSQSILTEEGAVGRRVSYQLRSEKLIEGSFPTVSDAIGDMQPEFAKDKEAQILCKPKTRAIFS